MKDRYNVTTYSVQYLLGLIDQGFIAIPEIQRPFVWDSTKVRDLMDKCKSRAGTSCTDLKRQLNFLFRPRFLRSPAVFERYSRYLRGAKLRAERIASAPARDEAKLETIEAYLDRFYLAADSVEEITDKPELEAFWLLTEECRLAVFAPEISPAIRAPLKKLEPAWEELRF